MVECIECFSSELQTMLFVDVESFIEREVKYILSGGANGIAASSPVSANCRLREASRVKPKPVNGLLKTLSGIAYFIGIHGTNTGIIGEIVRRNRDWLARG